MPEEKKTPQNKLLSPRRTIAVLIAGILFAFGFGLGKFAQESPDPSPAQQESLAEDEQKDADPISAEKELLSEIKQYIADEFLYEVDSSLEVHGLSKGLVDALGDPYSMYFTPDEYTRFIAESDSHLIGVGAYIRQDLTTGAIVLLKTIPGGPAAKAGLLAKDYILSVDGISTEGRPMDLVIKEQILGEEGTAVSITIYRPSTDQTLTFELKRENVVFPIVDFKMVDSITGYLQISEFSTTLPEEFFSAIDQLKQTGMQQLILDLRNNPGGDLEAAVAVADYLLPDSLPDSSGQTPLVTIQDKRQNLQRYYCNDGHQVDVPIAVLANGESASASELLTAALRDNGRAILVGTKTFGKGIVQSLYPLSNGGGIKLTTANYATPSGFLLHGIGLTPDVPVKEKIPSTEDSVSLESDQCYQTAVKTLDEIRTGTRSLPAITAQVETIAPPAAFIEKASAAIQNNVRSFDQTINDIEQHLLPALIADFHGSVYSRNDSWIEDVQTGYSREIELHLLQDGSYVNFTVNHVTQKLQSVELCMPTAQAVNYTMQLLTELVPSLPEAVRKKIRTELPLQSANEDGTLPEIKGVDGCTVYAAEGDGFLTVMIDP